MKIDVVSGVIFIFCVGVLASALASSGIFSGSDAAESAIVTTQLKE